MWDTFSEFRCNALVIVFVCHSRKRIEFIQNCEQTSKLAVLSQQIYRLSHKLYIHTASKSFYQ